ncbi:MAG TPA: hypothetical protein VLJ58_16835 [Ramlibacter sp.]|nr:hypothetical protein [Ramlibacter sp.]
MTTAPIPPIVLTISNGEAWQLTGFRYWWLKHVEGFDLTQHCARCLVGRYDKRVTRDMVLGVPIELESRLVYLCGVSPRYATNFHAAVEHAPGEVAELATYNGHTVRFEHGRLLPIPELPRGWGGMGAQYTDCRNFRFAVHSSGANADHTSA